jgi:hypothetical protein
MDQAKGRQEKRRRKKQTTIIHRWPLGRYYIDACKCLTHR